MSIELDDEVAGDDRRDRVAVHLVWDGVLLIAAIVATALLYVRSSAALSGDGLRNQLVAAAASLLLASAFAVSLRAAVPNLAVGSVAGTAGVLVGWLTTDQDVAAGTAAAVAAGGGAGVGLLLGIVVVALRAPAWAASLAAVPLLTAAALQLAGGPDVVLAQGPDLLRWPWPLFLGAVLISVAGGAVAVRPRTRAVLGAYRPTGDPATRRRAGGNAVAIAALALSSLLAAAAGLVTVFQLEAAVPANSGLTMTTLTAVAAVLLGGVSVHGRRGGILGTALAVVTIQLLLQWFGLANYPRWTPSVVVGAAIVVGLLASRIVEALGTPPPTEPAPVDASVPPPWSQPGYEPDYDRGYPTGYEPGYQPAEPDRR
jgi:ribose/xylose/arabinose/galactoside ABC-type transport system permease subunit